MKNAEDWVLSPAMANPPLCSYLDLIDGSLDLCDIARMNEALSVRAENGWRMQRAIEAANKG